VAAAPGSAPSRRTSWSGARKKKPNKARTLGHSLRRSNAAMRADVGLSCAGAGFPSARSSAAFRLSWIFMPTAPAGA
jgi:hypothetical protein